MLQEHGAKTDVTCDGQEYDYTMHPTPFSLAVQGGKMKAVKLLLANGVRLNDPNSAGDGVLMSAFYADRNSVDSQDNNSLLKLLIEAGRDVNEILPRRKSTLANIQTEYELMSPILQANRNSPQSFTKNYYLKMDKDYSSAILLLKEHGAK